MIKPTVTGYWMVLDLLINWDTQQVSIYIDNVAIGAQPFFLMRALTADSANALSIYGLTPGGVSRFKNLQMCDDVCIVDGGK